MTPTTETLPTIAVDNLASVTGGFLGFGRSAASTPAAKPTPSPSPTPTPTPRKELSDAELEERFQEHEQFRAWEKRHPFGALMCQGDSSCMY